MVRAESLFQLRKNGGQDLFGFGLLTGRRFDKSQIHQAEGSIGVVQTHGSAVNIHRIEDGLTRFCNLSQLAEHTAEVTVSGRKIPIILAVAELVVDLKASL